MRLEHFLRTNRLTSRLVNVISNNPMYSGALVIGSGTVLAQLIGITTLPIISRIFSPDEMGVLAVYSSILSIAVISASFRYEFAYPLPKNEEMAANLFVLCLIFLAVTSVGFSLIFLFTGDLITRLLGLDSLKHYYWLLIPGFISVGLYSILSNWAIRQRDYHRLTYTKINQTVSGTLSKIILGILSFGSIGLIVGHIISQAAGIGTLGKAMWKREKENFNCISLANIRLVARKYWSFPAFNLPSSIMNTVALHLPALMLMANYGSEIVGLYALAQGLLILPGSIISTSIGQAFLGEASKMVREGSLELKSAYIRTTRHLAIVAIPIFGILALTAPFITGVIFGDAWADAGWYFLPLAPMAMFQFIASPTSKLTIYGYNHWMLGWDTVRVSMIFVGFIACRLLDVSALLTLVVYSLIMIVMYIVLIQLNLKAIARYTKRIKCCI